MYGLSSGNWKRGVNYESRNVPKIPQCFRDVQHETIACNNYYYDWEEMLEQWVDKTVKQRSASEKMMSGDGT